MTEYLKSIEMEDDYNLKLSMAELKTDQDGEQRMEWFRTEPFTVFNILSLGNGKAQAGLDHAYRIIKFKQKFIGSTEQDQERMELTEEPTASVSEVIIFPHQESPYFH